MVTILKVKDIIKSDLASGSDKGEIIFKLISENFKKKENIIIDFSGIETLTTAFLNKSIGELYRLGTPEELNKYIQIDSGTLSSSQIKRVSMVQKNSRNKLSQEIIDEVMENE